jgi:hypothetical protein
MMAIIISILALVAASVISNNVMANENINKMICNGVMA